MNSKAIGVIFALLNSGLFGVILLAETARGGDGNAHRSSPSGAIAQNPAEKESKPGRAAKGETAFCMTHCGFSVATAGWPELKRAAIEANPLKLSLPVKTKEGVRIEDLKVGYSKPRGIAAYELRWPPQQTLHVAFVDHTDDPRLLQDVRAYARQWQDFANLQIDFEGIDYSPSGTLPEIAITFGGGGGESAIGTNSVRRTKSWSMRLGILGDLPESEVRAIVLHEFGHALGFLHEHQHPKHTIRWKQPDALQFFMRTQGWSEQQVREQVFEPLQGRLAASAFDLRSIMLYPIPGFLTEDNLEVGRNSELSENDQKVAAFLYPPTSNPELQSYIKTSPGFMKSGVTVCALRANSPLKHLHDAAGNAVAFKPGSVVEALAGVDVKNVGDFDGAVKKADSRFQIRFVDPTTNAVVTAVGPVKGDPKEWPTP